MQTHTMQSDPEPSMKTENGKKAIELNNVLNNALNELIDIQKNEDNEPGWVQYLKTDVWEDKYYGKNS